MGKGLPPKAAHAGQETPPSRRERRPSPATVRTHITMAVPPEPGLGRGRPTLRSEGSQAASWGLLETSALPLRVQNLTLPGYRCWNKGRPGHQDGTLPEVRVPRIPVTS